MMNVDAIELTQDEKKKKRLKRILAFLGILLLVLLAALIYYLLTQRPLVQDIPGAPKQGPRFVKSVFGDFTDLSGVAVNKRGDKFYVADSQGQKVWMVSKAGKVLGSFGKAATSPEDESGFGMPMGVAVSPQDEVYVSDRLGARILVFSPLGKFLRRFRPAEDGFEWSPLGVTVDKDGNVYVVDAKKEEHRVLKFDKAGKLLLTFGKQGSKAGEFNYPNGIAVSKTGDIYVVDSSNSRIQVFDKKGKFKKSFSGAGAGAFTHPVGIDISRNNEVHVVESFGHDVQVYDYSGAYLYAFGSQGVGDGQFRYPKGIAIAPDGTAFISDHDNRRLQIWKY